VNGQPHVEILAHHGLLLAIPAFVPALAVAGVIVYVAMRDRRSAGASQSDHTDSPDENGKG
jgi:hypothetical protein